MDQTFFGPNDFEQKKRTAITKTTTTILMGFDTIEINLVYLTIWHEFEVSQIIFSYKGCLEKKYKVFYEYIHAQIIKSCMRENVKWQYEFFLFTLLAWLWNKSNRQKLISYVTLLT